MIYRNVTHKGASIEIKVTCPKGHTTVLSTEGVDATSAECDICGPHMDVDVSWICEKCKKGYIFDLYNT